MEVLVQQVLGLAGIGNGASPSDMNTHNASVPLNGTASASTSPPQALPSDLSSLIGMLLSMSALRDWLKLIVIGSILETFRRCFFSVWGSCIDSFFITAQFKEEDSSFDWMMVWLSKQPSWKKARQVEVSTANFGLNSAAICVPGEEDATNGRKLAYLPSVSTTYSIWYKRRWMQISRTQGQTGFYGRSEDTLHISILTRDHGFLNDLLLEAKRDYMASEEKNISIFISDATNNWRHVASRPKRPLKSIVLDPGMKDLLIEDAKDFMESKSWYADRGIPFRRGYLLYGAPGSGKTSIIHSLAGELGLDVYVVSLSRSGLDDTALSELISELPEKCIALMEDIDAAFHTGLNRDGCDSDASGDDKKGNNNNGGQPSPGQAGPQTTASRITLSGLLNALDGVGAQEGRILYATTNKYAALDPALCRPGRMDLHVEFKLASQYQAQELYRCFYLPADDTTVDGKTKQTPDSGYSSPTGSPDRKVIDLAPEDDEKAVDIPLVSANSKKIVITPPPMYTGSSHRARAPRLSRDQVDELATKFALSIPEREFSMASLQGYLMAYKTRPYEAVHEAVAWVAKERADRAEKHRAASQARQAASVSAIVPATALETKADEAATAT